ncbi:MAG: hypothetical protein M1826_001824 [Phylliscum demangeonii]|nr:MAG: hypothetical protein M1826_001824 [Phylliscum demangeonii]
MMQTFLLLWTIVAAAGMALSAPLGESTAAAEYAVASDVSPLEKRGLLEDRAKAVDDVAYCVWEARKFSDGLGSCITQHKAEKYRLSAKEVKAQFVEICMRGTVGSHDSQVSYSQFSARPILPERRKPMQTEEKGTHEAMLTAETMLCQGRAIARVDCERFAERTFQGDDHRHPSGLRRMAKIMNHRIKTTGHALVHAAQRTASRTRSWAKSIFNRPSAFQNSVREKEGVGAMHPVGPIRVPE